MKTEAKIQQDIVMWYRNKFCLSFHEPKHLIFSVPNESSSKEETMRKMATGLLSGVSDIIIVQPCKVVFIEVKDNKGVQRENQKIFEQDVRNLGFEYYLVLSLEDFIKIIEKNEEKRI